jgi:RNA polymerase sigma-70 factor (ECF subfamily)
MSGTFPQIESPDEVCSGDPIQSASPASPTALTKVLQTLRSDEDLAEQLRAGHADPLTTLFKRHNQLVFRIARRILHNDAEAEDTVQQIFLDVFRSIEQFDRQKGTFKTWLLMFAYHRTLNRRRSLLASHFFDTDPLQDFLPELLECSWSNHTRLHDRILIQQVLRNLQPRQRRTVELTYYEGLTAEEISERTGETVRVVRHNLYRGLEALRKAMRKPGTASSSAPEGGRE